MDTQNIRRPSRRTTILLACLGAAAVAAVAVTVFGVPARTRTPHSPPGGDAAGLRGNYRS